MRSSELPSRTYRSDWRKLYENTARQATPLEIREAITGEMTMSRGLDKYPPRDIDIAAKEMGAIDDGGN